MMILACLESESRYRARVLILVEKEPEKEREREKEKAKVVNVVLKAAKVVAQKCPVQPPSCWK